VRSASAARRSISTQPMHPFRRTLRIRRRAQQTFALLPPLRSRRSLHIFRALELPSRMGLFVAPVPQSRLPQSISATLMAILSRRN